MGARLLTALVFSLDRVGCVIIVAISPLGDAQCITLGGHALARDHDVSGARVRFME
jgi:hypothetical protein